MKDVERRLIEAATKVRANAHARYSGYRVGAALLDDRGRLHVGCNVENAALPSGICAEAAAIAAMVAAGGQRIRAIAAVGGRNGPEPCSPCGGCRQRILEFADEATRVIAPGEARTAVSYTIAEILPASFRFR